MTQTRPTTVWSGSEWNTYVPTACLSTTSMIGAVNNCRAWTMSSAREKKAARLYRRRRRREIRELRERRREPQQEQPPPQAPNTAPPVQAPAMLNAPPPEAPAMFKEPHVPMPTRPVPKNQSTRLDLYMVFKAPQPEAPVMFKEPPPEVLAKLKAAPPVVPAMI